MTTSSRSQGAIGIERMCQLAGVSRPGYYRRWQRSAPRREETGLRDVIQCLALKHRHYGYRRIGALLRREGWHANHKRVLRLMREDNLLCLRQIPFVPMTTNSQHSWYVVSNLARGMVLTGLDQLWVAPSGRSRPGNPIDRDHLFRTIATTYSERSRPPVPIDRDHPFRAIATSLWMGVTEAVG